MSLIKAGSFMKLRKLRGLTSFTRLTKTYQLSLFFMKQPSVVLFGPVAEQLQGKKPHFLGGFALIYRI